MTKKRFLLFQAKVISAYQSIHFLTNKNMSAMTFIGKYGSIFRFIYEKFLSQKPKLFIPFQTLINENGERVIVNINLIKYIIDRGDEIKIKLEDGDELHIKGREHYQDFLENFE